MFRAIKYSSSWISFNSDINRITQVLVNNGFPLLIVDSIIQRSLHKYMTINADLPKDTITFYVRLSNLHTMKLDERTLSNILHQHVMPTETDQKIKLISYFWAKKPGSCFSTRPPKIDPDRVSDGVPVLMYWGCLSGHLHWSHRLYPQEKKRKECFLIQTKSIWYYNVYIHKLKLSINYSD